MALPAGITEYPMRLGTARHNPPPAQLVTAIGDAIYRTYGPGYSFQIRSGITSGTTGAGTSSGRHTPTSPGAADVQIFAPDGHQLYGAQLTPLAKNWVANYGSMGINMAPGNAGYNFTHMDLITNRGHLWGYPPNGGGGHLANLPKSMQAAILPFVGKKTWISPVGPTYPNNPPVMVADNTNAAFAAARKDPFSDSTPYDPYANMFGPAPAADNPVPPAIVPTGNQGPELVGSGNTGPHPDYMGMYGSTDVVRALGNMNREFPTPPTVGATHSKETIMRMGVQGSDVYDLQSQLASMKNPNTGRPFYVGPIDGKYGPATVRAVAAFQHTAINPVTKQRFSGPVDGVAGPITMQAIQSVLGQGGITGIAKDPGDQLMTLAAPFDVGGMNLNDKAFVSTPNMRPAPASPYNALSGANTGVAMRGPPPQGYDALSGANTGVAMRGPPPQSYDAFAGANTGIPDYNPLSGDRTGASPNFFNDVSNPNDWFTQGINNIAAGAGNFFGPNGPIAGASDWLNNKLGTSALAARPLGGGAPPPPPADPPTPMGYQKQPMNIGAPPTDSFGVDLTGTTGGPFITNPELASNSQRYKTPTTPTYASDFSAGTISPGIAAASARPEPAALTVARIAARAGSGQKLGYTTLPGYTSPDYGQAQQDYLDTTNDLPGMFSPTSVFGGTGSVTPSSTPSTTPSSTPSSTPGSSFGSGSGGSTGFSTITPTYPNSDYRP